MKHGVPQWSFLDYLPPRINNLSEPIKFADDISIIMSSTHFDIFCSLSNTVLPHIDKLEAGPNHH